MVGIRKRKALVAALALGILAIPASYVAHARLAIAGALQPLAEPLVPRTRHPELPEDPDELRRWVLELMRRNESLRADRVQYQDRFAQLADEIARLGEFRRLADRLGIAQTEAVGARILRRGVNWDRGAILIQAGKRDGIEAGCGVMAGPVVMGVVIEAGQSVSRVALVTARGVQVPARVVEARRNGLLRGAGGHVQLQYIGGDRESDEHPPVQPGHAVVTAGLDGVFPAGLLIGEVKTVEAIEGDLFRRIVVEPAARFDQVETVIVLRRRRVAVD